MSWAALAFVGVSVAMGFQQHVTVVCLSHSCACHQANLPSSDELKKGICSRQELVLL